MSKFTFWKDLFKFSNDVLDEDYHFDKNYSLKLKTKSQDNTTDYSFKAEQTKPDESGSSTNTMELKFKYSDEYMASENKYQCGKGLTSENEVVLDSLHEQFKGWRYVLTAKLMPGQTLDKSSFASSLKFKQANAEATVHLEHTKAEHVEFEGTFKPWEDRHIVVGGSSKLNYKQTNLAGYNLGFLNRLNGKFSYGFENWSPDGKDFGHFKFHTLQTVNASTDVATRIEYDWSSKQMDAVAGFLHRSRNTLRKGQMGQVRQAVQQVPRRVYRKRSLLLGAGTSVFHCSCVP